MGMMIASGSIMGKFDVFFTILTFFPLFITLACALCVRKIAPLLTFIVASLCYKAFFVWVCFDALFVHSDAQSAIVLILAPFAALVFMVPLCIIAFIQEDMVSKDERIEIEKQDANLPPLKPWDGFDMSGLPPKD